MAFLGVYVSIAHHAAPFKYVCGSAFFQKRLLNSIRSGVVYAVGQGSLTRGGNDACYGEKRRRVTLKKDRNLRRIFGRCVFGSRPLDKGGIVRYYYGSHVC